MTLSAALVYLVFLPQDRYTNLHFYSLGDKAGVRLRPHDLRRHAATYASRSGVPLEIISKVILRHQDLKTTQVYLGTISDTEALKWIDLLYGK